jgi:abnormal spindle-like microcephaly-associated protein
MKSSREVLLRFSARFLSGEGDLTRHLMFMGYSVACKQTPLDEYRFAVDNLSQDLRDGVRIGRLVESYTNDFTLLQVNTYTFTASQIDKYIENALSCEYSAKYGL